MEEDKVKILCKIRDIYRSIAEFEMHFQTHFDLCLNEGMLLCSLKEKKYSSGEIAEKLGLTNSNTSKVIKSVESKGLIERIIGPNDKRQMYFILTGLGYKKLESIKCEEMAIPELLMSIVGK